MAVQKCENILLQAALKDFWSANPKPKKIKFVKTLTSLGSYFQKKLFKFESKSYGILFALLSIICLKLTGYTAKFALSAKASMFCLQDLKLNKS